jgi:hypothetical protein
VQIKWPVVVEWGKYLRENRAKEILPLTNQLTKQPALLEKQKVVNLVNKFPTV